MQFVPSILFTRLQEHLWKEEQVPAEILDFHSDGLRLNQLAQQTHLQMILGPSAHVCSRPGETQRIILRIIPVQSITTPSVHVIITRHTLSSTHVLKTCCVLLGLEVCGLTLGSAQLPITQAASVICPVSP